MELDIYIIWNASLKNAMESPKRLGKTILLLELTINFGFQSNL